MARGIFMEALVPAHGRHHSEFAERLRAMGALPGTVDQFGEFLQTEQVRWKAMVEHSGVQVD